MTDRIPPDQAARDRALTDLDTNFLVEAGAGSGKTTLMAGRVVALIAAGRPADHIAAVTFTRKAASELRERVQLELEKAQQRPELANDVFIGTIHSFCARLLRERPVEAGLDPRFRELDQSEADLLGRQWWDSWVERMHLAENALLVQLRELGVAPAMLAEAFRIFVRYPDVDFAAPAAPLPVIAPLVRKLSALLERGFELMPRAQPDGDWDKVQSALQQLRFEQRSRDWSRPVEFFDSLTLLPSGAEVIQKKWVRSELTAKDDKADAKAFGEELMAWRNGPADAALTAWYEHRYAPCVALLRLAADEFQQYRLSTGRLSFEDLLLRAAELLRSDRGARAALGERWRYVLVDEFQDTDPIQAEVLFLLGSTPPAPGAADDHWSEAMLRAGALFVVGDPKQSIYRFRRADVETYEQARTAIERTGAHLLLTANFRSLPAIAEFVNAHFGNPAVFPARPSPHQAAFAELVPMRNAKEGSPPGGLVARYEVVGLRGESNKDVVMVKDAELVASWIAEEIASGRAKPSDVLVLTRKKEALAEHARQLAARGIPVAVTGAAVAFEDELHELQLLLDLMRDPANPVLVAAVLEGRFLGVTPADLWAARQAGVRFSVATAPTVIPADDRTTRVVAGLAKLHGWLLRSHADAPDVFLSRVLSETGLLAHTAASDLGDVRAGLLVRLIEDVRAAALEPETSGHAAQDALARLLSDEVPDTPLLPGRSDAVRVMNLHKAKGLEATIVILAAPTENKPRAPDVAVRREGSKATGGVQIGSRSSFHTTVIAQPPGWALMQATEALFVDAENERLRYVAATRAKGRLLISEFLKELKNELKRPENREWSAFLPTFEALEIDVIPIELTPATGRAELAEAATDVDAVVKDVDQRRALAAAPSWAWKTVTASAKAESLARQSLEDVSVAVRGAGAAWGRAIHQSLEAAGRSDGGDLAATVRRIAAEEGIAPRAADVLAAVQRVLAGPVWRELMAAPIRRFEWSIAGWVDSEGTPTYLEGVIDAAWQTADGWKIVDWKTDDVAEPVWLERAVAYSRQLELYSALLRNAVGTVVIGSLVRVA